MGVARCEGRLGNVTVAPRYPGDFVLLPPSHLPTNNWVGHLWGAREVLMPLEGARPRLYLASVWWGPVRPGVQRYFFV